VVGWDFHRHKGASEEVSSACDQLQNFMNLQIMFHIGLQDHAFTTCTLFLMSVPKKTGWGYSEIVPEYLFIFSFILFPTCYQTMSDIMHDLQFSYQWLQRSLSVGLWHHVVFWIGLDTYIAEMCSKAKLGNFTLCLATCISLNWAKLAIALHWTVNI